MSSIFAVTNNCSLNALRDARLFHNLVDARKALKQIRDARRYSLGVDVVEDTEDKFVYLFGWEEHRVSFSIIELKVE